VENKIKLKICGMRDAENIMEVAALSPDYMGFIFYPKSPRYVGEDFRIPSDFPTNIIRVGVFVNESSDRIIAYARQHRLNFIQLHGSESVKRCEELKQHNLQVIKVFSIDEETTFEITKDYSAAADFVLFDTKGKYYGGNAQTFRWQRLGDYNQKIPFFLSGGLSPENIPGIAGLKDMNLYALDVNSGAERSPGVKDIKKIKAIQDIINNKL
jgi:phosphoribosylanthranilate isomerase